MKKETIKLKIPITWRKGQTIFNFLEWLLVEKGVNPNQNQRLADTFHIPDEKLEKYIKEFEQRF